MSGPTDTPTPKGDPTAAPTTTTTTGEIPAAVPAPALEEQSPEQKLAQVSELLRSGEPKAPGAPDPDADPLSLDALARSLERDPAELYKLKVPTRDGESVTLGELKDYHARQAEHDLAGLEWEERRQAEQAELTRTRAELAELLAAVPRDKLVPEVIERVRAQHAAKMAVEHERTLQRIPEWRDEARRDADLVGIRAYLADYGLPAGALNEIQDHRMLALLRDAWSRKSRLDQALRNVREVSNPTPAPSGRAASTKAGSTRQAPRNPTQAKLGEISKLLRGD